MKNVEAELSTRVVAGKDNTRPPQAKKGTFKASRWTSYTAWLRVAVLNRQRPLRKSGSRLGNPPLPADWPHVVGDVPGAGTTRPRMRPQLDDDPRRGELAHRRLCRCPFRRAQQNSRGPTGLRPQPVGPSSSTLAPVGGVVALLQPCFAGLEGALSRWLSIYRSCRGRCSSSTIADGAVPSVGRGAPRPIGTDQLVVVAGGLQAAEHRTAAHTQDLGGVVGEGTFVRLSATGCLRGRGV
jgi:hypothetical protein